MKIKELYEKWDVMNPHLDGYLLLWEESLVSFHIGYNNGQRCFVIIFQGKIDNMISTKAITVNLIKKEGNQSILSFTLNSESLDEIFKKLCWDLINVAKNNKCPILQIEKQYKKWINLLQEINENGLSRSKQKGLMGELLHLNGCLDKLEQAEVINAWVGPEGNDQDYVFKGYWMEIKAISRSSTEIKISSLQQLDRKGEGYLKVYFIDEISSSGINTISLCDLIEQVENKLINEDIKSVFTCKLTQYGYFEKDKEKYVNSYYYLEKFYIYKVEEKFPRLLRCNVPSEVVKANYSLDLASLEKWKIKEDE